MKLKCIKSYGLEFIVGHVYVVNQTITCGGGQFVFYEIMDEQGELRKVQLNNRLLWDFEIVDESEERKEDIIFEIQNLLNQLGKEFNKLKKLIK